MYNTNIKYCTKKTRQGYGLVEGMMIDKLILKEITRYQVNTKKSITIYYIKKVAA